MPVIFSTKTRSERRLDRVMAFLWALMMASGLAFMVYQMFWWEKPEECQVLPTQELPRGVKCP